MVVDFEFKRSPSYRVAYIAWGGPWNEGKIRSKFREVERWAKEHRLRTAKWIFREPKERRWEACIEVRGSAKPGRGIRFKTLPASSVARVQFDPESVSPRVVYHGLNDWLRWRKKDKEIKSVRSSREIYPGDPWKDPKAWAQTEVQFLVSR